MLRGGAAVAGAVRPRRPRPARHGAGLLRGAAHGADSGGRDTRRQVCAPCHHARRRRRPRRSRHGACRVRGQPRGVAGGPRGRLPCSRDRKSTRLNSSHSSISYAVFCLKKKNHKIKTISFIKKKKIIKKKT